MAMRVGDGRGEDCNETKRRGKLRSRSGSRLIGKLTVRKSGFFGSPTERAATKDLGFCEIEKETRRDESVSRLPSRMERRASPPLAWVEQEER